MIKNNEGKSNIRITDVIFKTLIVVITLSLMTGCSGFDALEETSARLYDYLDERESSNQSATASDEDSNGELGDEVSDESVNILVDNNLIESMDSEDGTDNSSDSGSNGISVYKENGELLETEIEVIDEDEAAYSDGSEVIAESLPKSQNELDHVNCYAYSKLNSEQRKAYREIYAVLSDSLSKVILSSKNPEDVDLAFRSVMVDHPEIFYVKGYSVGKYMLGDILDKIAFSGTYIYDKAEVESKRQEVEAYITNVIYSVPLANSSSIFRNT